MKKTVKLFKHQIDALNQTAGMNRVAYYHDMGLGKTFTGAEKMRQLGGRVNLVICQKSKIDDWIEHFRKHYLGQNIFNLSKNTEIENMLLAIKINAPFVGVINYELIFRRKVLLQLHFDTIMLDESSMIQNDTAKRTKAILKLQTDNVILLSGTPTGGKYENLYSQMRLLGWNISKTQYYSEFIETKKINMGGFKIPVVIGYKNVGRLKRKMRQYGCNFLTYEQAIDATEKSKSALEPLPPQTFTDIRVSASKEYKKFQKTKLIVIDTRNGYEFHDESDFYGKDITPHIELVGDTTLTQMLYERQLCGAYSADKLNAFADLLESTNDRLIVFYNFNAELEQLKAICKRPVSEVNGTTKDLTAYEKHADSVTFIQYQAGAKGLNLQKANKIVYFTPTLSVEDYMQSLKRVHRIGQTRPCFYYRLICKRSIEERIYNSIENGIDYTEKLFKKGE